MASFQGYADFKYFAIDLPHPYVAHVQINRPEKMNAFVEDMWLELRQLFQALSYDSTVRSVVLSGAGLKAFTTGIDTLVASQGNGPLSQNSSAGASDSARTATVIRRRIAEFQDCITSVEKCEKPVLCVMHGYAFGLAIDLSTCADVRICAQDAKFSVKEVDVGIAADIGTLSRLPKVVGSQSWVKDVCLSARVFDADEALKMGFVTRVFPTKHEAIEAGMKWAVMVASKSPVAVQGTKELLTWSRDHSIQDGLRYTGIWNSASMQSKDVSAAILAGMQKKSATFEKL